jgi:hypothetical protein
MPQPGDESFADDPNADIYDFVRGPMATAALLNRSTTVRRVILLDAAASGMMGLLFLVGAGLIDQPLGLPDGLLRWTGLVLVPFAVGLVWIATRASIALEAVRTVIALNVVWAVGTPLLLLTGLVSPTLLGQLFVLAQAAAVAGFAYLEHRASR